MNSTEFKLSEYMQKKFCYTLYLQLNKKQKYYQLIIVKARVYFLLFT